MRPKLSISAWLTLLWAVVGARVVLAGCVSLPEMVERIKGLGPGQPISVASIRGNVRSGVVEEVLEVPGGRTVVRLRKPNGEVENLFLDQLDPASFKLDYGSIPKGSYFRVASKSGNSYEGIIEGLSEDGKYLKLSDGRKMDISRLNEATFKLSPPPPAAPPLPGAASPLIPKAQKLFAGEPADLGFGPEGNFRKMVRAPGGGSTPMFYNYADREFAKSAGRLFEGAHPSQLPRNARYTFVIKEDGTMTFGRVVDEWEFGVKHAHLAAGKPVVAAGELSIDATGAYRFNLESGSYTAKLVGSGQTTMAKLESKVAEVFKSEMGAAKGSYTTEVLVPKGVPSTAELKLLCASPAFLAGNARFCEGL